MGTHKLKGIEDLRAAPYNPRRIAPEAMHGLKRSMREFGDISGLVWNSQSGHLVAGHQRLTALRTLYGDDLLYDAKESCIITPHGERFTVRVVDWDPIMEKAANVAANDPLIAGEFTEGLSEIIAELKDEIPELVEDLMLTQMAISAYDGTCGDIDLGDGEIADKENMVRIVIMIPRSKGQQARK